MTHSPLPRGGSLQLPSPQSSASGEHFRAARLRKAKRLLRFSLSLEAVANIAGVSKAELDLALWNSLGETRKMTATQAPRSYAQNRRSYVGAQNPHARLDEDKVRAIRSRRVSGETYVSIAADYSVDMTTVRLICLGKRWAHVQ